MKKYLLFLAFISLLYAQTGARYLIIAYDNFYDITQPLAEWKYRKGMKSKLVRLSEVGYSMNEIKNYIQNAHNTWDIKPEYLLLVGAPNLIPFPTVSGTYSDNFYTDITGDFFNEILSGRMTVHDITEAANVINKTLLYERYTDCTDPEWMINACLIVNCDYDPDDSIYWSDAHHAAGLMVQYGFIDIDTLSDYYGHSSSHVIDAVNNGVGIVMYRGQGLNNWCPPFDVYPDQAQNGNKLPIVLSTTCRTMGTGPTPAAAERWLLTGTVAQPKGAVGFFPTTTCVSNQAYLRSAVAKGFHTGLFTEGKHTFGQACEAGRCNVYRLHQYQGGLYEYLGFTTLGDPELNIWTSSPLSIAVEHPDFAAYEYDEITITVTDSSGNLYISGAIVCLAGDADTTVYVVDTTDTQGTVTMAIEPHVIDDTVYVTVTGHNILPYEGSLIVKMMSYCYMRYLNSWIDDSIGGNDDGKMNPTESIVLPLWIENIGESTGVNISGVLRTTDPFIEIVDSIRSFGNIPGQDSAFTGTDGYRLNVMHSCPDQHAVTFELHLDDINDSTWISTFIHRVHAPAFRFDGATTQGGNNNSIIDPGETLDVFITVTNTGSIAADSVSSILISESSDLMILDSIAVFDHIGADSSKINTNDPFTIAIDTATQVGTIMNFLVPITSNYLNDTLMFSMVVGEKCYYLWNPDPSPQSGENIHSILTSLGYQGDCGTALPDHMDLYRSLFICLGVYSNRYLIETNAPEAITITGYINGGGNAYLEGSSTWFVDPHYFNGHDFGPLFGLQSNDWSYGTLGPIIGQTSTFGQGMYFTYVGENAYMDHLTPIGNGVTIFRDVDNYYNCCIAQATASYRTVATDFELGFMHDSIPPSTRAALLDSIMKFFGVMNPGVHETKTSVLTRAVQFTVSPNPCRGSCTIQLTGTTIDKEAIIAIYDIAGRQVFLVTAPVTRSGTSFTWSGRDTQGRNLAKGVYFIQCTIDGTERSRKIVLMK
ncbi:T9SS type A sorting domain-containing protein [candidate division WOR-3 bacterium]|nr:T9SS type A sorting domain-containing protein [candidate division WOR-3 bacterium]